MAGKGEAYEHDVRMTGFGGGRGKTPRPGGPGAAGDVAGSRNEIDVRARSREKTEHGPETRQDTRTARANPRMHDHETTARDADPDIE